MTIKPNICSMCHRLEITEGISSLNSGSSGDIHSLDF